MEEQKLQLVKRDDYREEYANSVQVRSSLWDFFLLFGRVDPKSPQEVVIENFQGVYLSPQQAKALTQLLHQHIAQYEQSCGEIRLEPKDGMSPGTLPVN